MNLEEKQYLDILQNILQNGVDRGDRTGTGTRSVFGTRMEFCLSNGKFPLLTSKKMFLRGVFVELIWLIRGETNIKYLVDRKVHIWDEWPYQNYKKTMLSEGMENDDIMSQKEFIAKIKELPADDDFVVKFGNLGPVYGSQWRNFNGEGVDQLKEAVEDIRNNPESRRIVVSAWNPARLQDMLLPPCHMFYQFYCDTKNKKLSLQMYQRSADIFLGVPFNISSYSLLLILISKITGYEPGNFVHIIGDTHIYNNHFEQVKEQLTRETYDFPDFVIKKDIKTIKDLEELEWDDVELLNYNSGSKISAPISV